MSIVRSDRALDVVVDDGVIPGAAGDGAATDHRSSISVATPSNLRCSHVVLLKTVSPRVNSGVAKNARYPRICVRIVERGSRSFGAHSEETDLCRVCMRQSDEANVVCAVCQS
jgi:hypothetical protein